MDSGPIPGNPSPFPKIVEIILPLTSLWNTQLTNLTTAYLEAFCLGVSLVVPTVKNLPQCGRPGFDPWVGRMSWRMERPLLQYSCLDNSMDRGSWWDTVHGVTKSRTWLSDLPLLTCLPSEMAHALSCLRPGRQTQRRRKAQLEKQGKKQREQFLGACYFSHNPKASCFLIPS